VTWPVYSERFLTQSAAAAWATWRVPPGKRAVVRTITHVNDSTVAVKGVVGIGNFLIWSSTTPAKASTIFTNLTLVLYAGNELWLLNDAGPCFLSAHGYLFDDPTHRRSAPGIEGEEEYGEVDQLPAGA
jgi:hypothetical protein